MYTRHKRQQGSTYVILSMSASLAHLDIYPVGVAAEAVDPIFEDGFESGETSAWPGS